MAVLLSAILSLVLMNYLKEQTSSVIRNPGSWVPTTPLFQGPQLPGKREG